MTPMIRRTPDVEGNIMWTHSAVAGRGSGRRGVVEVAPSPRPGGRDCISSSKLVQNRSPTKLRPDPSLSVKVLPHPCSSQTLFQPISPEHHLSKSQRPSSHLEFAGELPIPRRSCQYVVQVLPGKSEVAKCSLTEKAQGKSAARGAGWNKDAGESRSNPTSSFYSPNIPKVVRKKTNV